MIRLYCTMIMLWVELTAFFALEITTYDDSYYIVCGGFNFANLLLLKRLPSVRLVCDIQLLVLCSLTVQFFGFLSYHFYYDTIFYNSLTWLFVILQIIRLGVNLRADDDDRDYKNNNWLSILCSSTGYWAKTIFKVQK